MDIDKIKSIDIVSFLAKHGLHPKKSTGKTAQYLSPFGKETQASFMVDLIKNRFTCYHSDQSGDVIDLVRALNNCSFKEAVGILSNDDMADVKTYTPPEIKKDGVEIVLIEELSDSELVDYMTQIRRIDYDVLMYYCKEVSFRFPYSKKDKERVYKAVGFANDMKGFELRSSWQKIASKPKMFTTIDGDDSEIDLWEGWVDFLSHLSINGIIKPKNKTYVLNGARMIRILKPFLEGKKVNAYVDSDKAGDEVIAELDKSEVVDRRGEFCFYNDYNAYWCDL